MRLLIFLIFCLWSSLVAGCALVGRHGPASADGATARDLSMQGIAAMEHGDWQRAESLLRQSLQSSSSEAQSHRYLAEVLWNRGATQEAIAQIVAATQADATDAPLAVRAGEMLLAVGATERAHAQADQAIRLDPTLSSAWALRGRAYWHLNQPDRALGDLHHALENSPNNRDVLLDLAAVYRQTGQSTRCLTTLNHLLDTYSPGEEPQSVLLMEGLALHDLGRGQQAAETLLAASQHGPPNAAVWCALAEAQAALGNYAEATASASGRWGWIPTMPPADACWPS